MGIALVQNQLLQCKVHFKNIGASFCWAEVAGDNCQSARGIINKLGFYESRMNIIKNVKERSKIKDYGNISITLQIQ